MLLFVLKLRDSSAFVTKQHGCACSRLIETSECVCVCVCVSVCVFVCVFEEKCSIYELTSAKLAFNVQFAMVLIVSSYQLL